MKYLILAYLFCVTTAMAADFTVAFEIPKEFTCEGAKAQLPLRFVNAPEKTVTFVVIMEDPDIPEDVKKDIGSDIFVHMVAYNIKGNVTEFKYGIGGEYAKNSKGEKAYRPPCPPSGTHRYITTVYALNKELPANLETKADVLKAFNKSNIIAEAKLVGTYSKKS